MSRGGQAALAETIERYLERVDFAADGYAARVWPRGREGLIVIDPQRSFGQPIIDRRGVRVRDVLDRLRAGESEDAVRADFDLDDAQVQAARAFEDRVYAEAA